ncbi:hypothetical protein [Paenibacillus crassostreae]|uniref:Uncharacterized protein n=1 Tax=Paenibacillus crassostreae TaxID=1763538 RepID=A0A167AS63_9BACL|nr:hypothetical protein [Paenibacillus crassostreae]AOZ93674.1 hypothetical protein LPB68_16720 [Paenibacillus crassostreae]OAB71368.1 hypothetical protein PNBC_19590 [Paenibacillus crassostreae]
MEPNKGNQRRNQYPFVLLISICILLTACSKGQTESLKPAPADQVGIPAGVDIKKVIQDGVLDNDYRKKVELLTDGGKRVTITDPKGETVMQQIEYEGVILEVNGTKVTVQVEKGGQQSVTIPSDVVIEDDENIGINKGVEIEWTVNKQGKIDSVELDD